MTAPRTIARIDALVWTLIYGGLFLLVLGIASHGQARVAGWSLSAVGVVAVAVGVVLIFVRARMGRGPDAS